MMQLQFLVDQLFNSEVVAVTVPPEVEALIQQKGLDVLNLDLPSNEIDALVFASAQSILEGNSKLTEQVIEHIRNGVQSGSSLRVVGCAYYACQLPLYIEIGDTLLRYTRNIYAIHSSPVYNFLVEEADEANLLPSPPARAGDPPPIRSMPRPAERFYEFIRAKQEYDFDAATPNPRPQEAMSQPVTNEEWQELSTLLIDLYDEPNLPQWLAHFRQRFGPHDFSGALSDAVAAILGLALRRNPKQHAHNLANLFEFDYLRFGAARTAFDVCVMADDPFMEHFSVLAIDRLMPRYWDNDRTFHADPLYRAMNAKVRLAVHRRLLAAGHPGLAST